MAVGVRAAKPEHMGCGSESNYRLDHAHPLSPRELHLQLEDRSKISYKLIGWDRLSIGAPCVYNRVGLDLACLSPDLGGCIFPPCLELLLKESRPNVVVVGYRKSAKQIVPADLCLMVIGGAELNDSRDQRTRIPRVLLIENRVPRLGRRG